MLPVKQQIAESLAMLIASCLPSSKMRLDINNALLMDACLAKSSQFRIVWVMFIDKLSQLISFRLFQESYASPFIEFM